MRTPSPDSVRTSVADAAECGAMLRGGSHSFFAASLVLPGELRRPATALYAFAGLRMMRLIRGRIVAQPCRNCGGAWSGSTAARRTIMPLTAPLPTPWTDSTSRKPCRWRCWRASHGDAQGRQYESFSHLIDYAVRVAGTVGMMMAMIMGIRDARSLARAADLGVAMQLTNIARDVGEDSRHGRLYLPLQWLREAGIEPAAWLARPEFSEPLAQVIRRLLAAAEALYERSESGLARLPSACRPAMYAARLLYAEIGRELARRHYDSVGQRAVVSWPRKASLLADAVLAATMRRAPKVGTEALAEADFLLEPLAAAAIAAGESTPAAAAGSLRWPRMEPRIVWVLDLFERLERQGSQGLERRLFRVTRAILTA